jgi:hypothetical protein
MVFDRNPKFGKDHSFSEGARRVTDLLWENTGGDVSQFPKSYLENLRYEFSDGNVSMLELIDRVDLGPDATYEDYCEVVEALLSVDPGQWPDPSSVVEVPSDRLQFEVEEVLAEEEIVEKPADAQQSDAMSEKMETFLKKVIASVYLDGVTEVTDAEGNPPTAANNYLLSEDGKNFSGVFYDSPPNEKAKKFPFVISEKADGVWQIQY